MTLEFSGPLWDWKGPAPHYFATVPAGQSQEIKVAARFVTCGWGMVPVRVRLGQTEWKASLFPGEGLYILPIKLLVRKAASIGEGDKVAVQMEVSWMPARWRKND